MIFGTRLKTLRIENNLRQQDLAEIINVHRATIGKYETNERFPDRETLGKIADFFQVSIDYLFGRTEIRNLDEFLLKYSMLNINGLSSEALLEIQDYINYVRLKYNNKTT